MTPRKPYPTNVSDEEWAFAAPYLTLMTEQAPQRKYELRAMFNALRWMARAGAPRRLLPNDFPPWEAVYSEYTAGSPKVLVSPTIKVWEKAGATDEDEKVAQAICRDERDKNVNLKPSSSDERSKAYLDCMLRQGFRHKYRNYVGVISIK